MIRIVLMILALGAACLACSDDEGTTAEPEDQAEGEWLKYWSGSQPVRLNLGVDYYAVRFTKPAGWAGVHIDSVEIVATSSGQISLSFWPNTVLESGTHWPSGSATQATPVNVVYGGNAWDVTSYDWTTTSAEFFVGFQQGDVITLASDGKAEPEVRSYRIYEGQDWELEMAMASNYCIGVFVTPTS